jgi:hypothetical protein
MWFIIGLIVLFYALPYIVAAILGGLLGYAMVFAIGIFIAGCFKK